MTTLSPIIQEDVQSIARDLGERLGAVEGSSWLISGGAGFLGAYFLDLLVYCNREIFQRPCRLTCVENFSSGKPARIAHLKGNQHLRVVQADIARPLKLPGSFDYLVHAASIASPTFYRKYPLATIEANVLGLKNMLDLGRSRDLRSFLYFSSSEVYGDPPADRIPTPEDYNGNVSCTGPRACYDESKRLGETLAVNYQRQYGVPVKIVRPFNVYGPGLNLNDLRVIPDFFRDALFQHKIGVLSDGRSTRSFCYVRDAVTGFFQALLSPHDGEVFNIGNDEGEISMKDLAEQVSRLVGGVPVEFRESEEVDYLTDHPRRRRPDLTKARTLLGYRPRVTLAAGLARTWGWYRETGLNPKAGLNPETCLKDTGLNPDTGGRPGGGA
jgi:UDP-glucuronate decarboxylase